MAWDRRRSPPSSRRGAAGMKGLESSSSLQQWACSSLSSSEKFLSIYDKMHEDREKKSFDSHLLCTPRLQQLAPADEEQFSAALLSPKTTTIENSGSKIVFPHITSRGALVGKNVHCKTSIHNRITWRQKSSTQRMRTSLMILNFYQARSVATHCRLLGVGDPTLNTDDASATSQDNMQQQNRSSLDKQQCRELFLGLAGAAGMRLICPPLQLPLLEIVLFFRRQLLSSSGGGGVWRFPVNLALATLRPFCGSLLRRCLTAMLCLAQVRTRNNNNIAVAEHLRYMPVVPDLNTVVFEQQREHLDHIKGFTIRSANRVQIDDLVVTTTTEVDDDADAWDSSNRTTTNGLLLSNVVFGSKFDGERWSGKGGPVVEILIRERDSLSENIVANFVVHDEDDDRGFDPVFSECGSLFSLVDLDLELELEVEGDKLASSNRLLLKHNERKELISVRTAGSGNVLLDALEQQLQSSQNCLLPSRERPHVAVVDEEARNESLNAFEGSMKVAIGEIADELWSPPRRGECNEENSSTAWEETLENELDNDEFQEHWKSFRFGSADSLFDLDLEVCAAVEEHRIAACDGVIMTERPEEEHTEAREAANELIELPVLKVSVTLTEVVESREAKSGHCLDEKPGNGSGLDCPIDDNRIGGNNIYSASLGRVREQTEVIPSENSGATNNLLEAAVVVLVDKKLAQALTEAEVEENGAVKEIEEVNSTNNNGEEKVREIEEVSFTNTGEETSSERVLAQVHEVCPIAEYRIRSSDFASPEKRLQEKTADFLLESAGAENENARAAETVPVEKLSVALMEAAVVVYEGDDDDDQEINDLELEQWLGGISADTGVLDCPIEDLIESLIGQTEIFLSERSLVENELETDNGTISVDKLSLPFAEELESKAVVKEIQEVKSTHSVKKYSGERIFDEDVDACERRIEDGSPVSSEGEPGDSTEGLVSERARDENELDVKEWARDGNELDVKEIQNVQCTGLLEGESEELLLFDLERFQFELELCPVVEHRIGDSDRVVPQMVHSRSDVSLSDWISAEDELDNGSAAFAPAASLPEVLENQAVTTKIQEVEESTHSSEEKSAEKALNEKFEMCPLEDRVIHDVFCSPSERSGEGQAEDFLGFYRDASGPDEEELHGRFSSSNSSQDSSSGQQHGLPSSSPMTVSAMMQDDDDSQSEETASRYEYILIPRAGATSSEPSTHISSTRRPNHAKKAENNALDSNSGFVTDELHRDQKADGYSRETKPNAIDVTTCYSIHAQDESELPLGPNETETTIVAASPTAVVSARDAERNLDQRCADPNRPANEIGVNGDTNCFPEMCPISSATADPSSFESCGVAETYPEHPFADHPTCIDLRERRHSHGDQTYIDMKDLLPPPWGQLIFWHGHCKEGRPTLCVLLGKAVRQLPQHELKAFIAVTVSHLEYAEVNFFKANVKQMNILMDLDGLGFMRLPPMHILSSIGAVLNRDYAGRGGWIILLNAPLMLGFVINAIQGVILRPSHNKGADIDSSFKGFLEGKEKIMMMGSKHRPDLLRYFDDDMLPAAFGGNCPCGSDEELCKVGSDYLKLLWNTTSRI